MFKIGDYFPPQKHEDRIKRYKSNKKLVQGFHYDVFERIHNRLSKTQRDIIYISANLPGVIAKKSADFLFGETPSYAAGREGSPEQAAIERFVEDNDLNITNYESALGNAYRGDAFYKVMWAQFWRGELPEEIDPFRVVIEAQNANYVFPETLVGNDNLIMAYHIAVPQYIEGNEWILDVESHYPGRIVNRVFRMNALQTTVDNEVVSWKIYAEIEVENGVIETGVPYPLVVHIPNFSYDDSWEGQDDLTEHISLFDELNNRLSQLAVILDKHADPAIAVPVGTIEEDEQGNPIFHVGRTKVFEVQDKNDIIPEYITWDGQLDANFREIEKVIDLILTAAEMPPVSLGKDNSGTSGASGLSIKWRMSSLLSKINRKRQYYDKGLKTLLYIAQLLEHAQSDEKLDYIPTVPKITFRDGLPDDELEMANVMSIRTGGMPTISQRKAIKILDNLTEEQVDDEVRRIREEQDTVDASIYNMEGGG
ncbi:phage portal protein [Aneurinibacillus aneurinilyticus]|uniref:phage portal protein n=1 Tax=Aneurinibacillus aneurinilyticus TaxID=1391 RepID=UPI0023F11E62|nr:phage portal protein [Aneurinibacillus aneurinilyticus]